MNVHSKSVGTITLLIILGVIISMVNGGVVLAQDQEPTPPPLEMSSKNVSAPDPNAVVSIICVNRPLKEVLSFLTNKTGYSFETEGEEIGNRLVTLTDENTHYSEVLDHIAENALVTFEATTSSKYTVYKVVMLPELVFNKSTVADAVQMIALKAGWNVIIPEQLRAKTVTLRWKNISAMKAMQAILKMNGFIAVREKNRVIRITTPNEEQLELRTVVIPLNYIDPTSTRYVATLSVAQLKEEKAETPQNSNLIEILKNTKSAGGRIDYHKETNKLILTDTAAKIDELRKIIKEIDIKPQQILIDIRVVTVNQNELEEKGFKWEIGAFMSAASLNKHLFPFNLGDSWERPISPKSFSNGGASDSELFGYEYGSLSFAGTSVAMKFLESLDSSKIVQQPLLLAMNHQPSTIFVGKKIRWAQATIQSEDGVSSRVYSEADGSPVEEGVQILVVPHITGREGDIIMTVIPDISELVEWFVIGEGTASELQLPILAQKTVVTRMIIKDGHTGVIAGLIRDRQLKNRQRVPVLGKIPVLNKLFTYKKKEIVRENMMIFVTPKIVESGSTSSLDNQEAKALDDIAKLHAKSNEEDFPGPARKKEKNRKSFKFFSKDK